MPRRRGKARLQSPRCPTNGGVPAAMWLLIRSGQQTGRVIEITGERFVIGRDDDCDLQVLDEKISRKHASFVTHADGRVILQDLGSTNGTFIDEQRVTQPTEVRGDEQVR